MNKRLHVLTAGVMATATMMSVLAAPARSAEADNIDWGSVNAACKGLPTYAQLKQALDYAQSPTGGGNGGFGLEMWGTVVNRDGIVCAVAFTGSDRGSQWPGSRVISAQKANTANAFSLPGLALSTADLYAAVQPGGSLFGLQESNPVDTAVAYGGSPTDYGQRNDPMLGKRIGGVNVFGGGLGLYNAKGVLLGGIGVSGDTSCADHNIAWKTRHRLNFDFIPGGVSLNGDDNINYIGHVPAGTLAHDFSHAVCSIAGSDAVVAISANLPPVQKVK